VNVTQRILIFCTRFNLSNVSGMLNLFLSFIHKDYFLTLTKIREMLLEAAQSDICWSSLDLVLTLAAGIIR